MAEEGAGGGERSQDPTGKRLETAREEGNVAQSRELQMFVVLALFLMVFTMQTAAAARTFVHRMRALMEHFYGIPQDGAAVYGVTMQAMTEGVRLAGPLVLVIMVTVVVFGFLQTGFLFRPEAVALDITRLSPMKGVKRVFSVTNLVEVLKSLVKFCMFGLLLYGVAKGTVHVAPEAERWTFTHLTSELVSWFLYATLTILVVQSGIALLDDMWTRYHRLTGLRMSFQDIKEETRQTEGDPHIKGKRQQIRRRRARQRMLQAVKNATVVVTNPTHYAVALEYQSGSDTAPRIVAKGMDDLAARIRMTAEDAKVPVVRNPTLARGLYTLPVDSEIPPEYFQPVAAIIAYVMKLKTPGSRVARRN